MIIEVESMSHSAESVGSNTTSKKHIIGKRKRETGSGACSSSSSRIMAHPECPATSDLKHQRIAFAVFVLRFKHNEEYDVPEIAISKGRAYWEKVTEIANDGKYTLTIVDAVYMAKEVKKFHITFICDCLGKFLCENIVDRGAPIIPGEAELKQWIEPIQCISNSGVNGIGASSSKHMRVYDGYASTLLTLPACNELDDAIAPSSFATVGRQRLKVKSLVHRCNLPSTLKVILLVAMTKCPEIGGLVAGMTESELHSFLRRIEPNEYKDWLQKKNSS